MTLDLDKLENVVIRNGKLIARCPACEENGDDGTGDHLFIADEGDGPFGCVINEGPAGAEHRRRIWELVGVKSQPFAPRNPGLVCHRVGRPAVNAKHGPKPHPTFPELAPPTDDALETIRELRCWSSTVGLELLSARGLLWDGDIFDNGTEWPAWVITDSAGLNAQARTYDGAPWMGIGGKKAKTLPGSTANWPIGAPEIGDRPNVILCEGQPDFCAALLVAWFEDKAVVDKVAPVCIAGAGHSIHPGALHYFTGKRVRIVTHNDPGGQGQEAAAKWAKQLQNVLAAEVDQINFGALGLTKRDGTPIKDLADYATLLDVEDFPDLELFAGWLDME